MRNWKAAQPIPDNGRMKIAAPVAVLALTILVGACSSPTYPPNGRASFAPAPARTDVSAPAATSVSAPTATNQTTPRANTRLNPRPYDGGSTLSTRKERWWPKWSDPANWFLEDQYQL